MMSNTSKSHVKNTRIEEIMSKKPMVTLNADSTAFDAAKKMSENLISSIIPTDSDRKRFDKTSLCKWFVV